MHQAAEDFIGILAPYARQLNFEILSLSEGKAVVKIPENPALVRDLGMVCGQSILSAADSLGPICIISKMGEYRDMTTVNIQCHFLRPIPAGDFVATLELVRLGRKISVVNAHFTSKQKPDLCAMATTTYSFL